MSNTFRDAMRAAVRVTLTGRSELLVENCAGICEFCDTSITLRTSEGALIIGGSALKILRADEGEVTVGGEISSVSYI